MAAPSFGKWLVAGTVVVAGVAIAEQYDERLAWGMAVIILMAAFFRYPGAMTEIRKMLGT